MGNTSDFRVSSDLESGHDLAGISSDTESFLPIELEEFDDSNSHTYNTNNTSFFPSETNQNQRRLHYSQYRLVALFQKLVDGPRWPRDEPPVVTVPFLRSWDEVASTIRKKVSNRVQLYILVAYLSIWFLVIYSIISPQLKDGPRLGNSDGLEVVTLSCTGNGYFWKGKNQQCALDASLCEPFQDREVIVKCPALCDRDGWTYSATPVGTEMVKYRSYSIGGGKLDNDDSDTLTYPYRGDSSPCASGVHAGLVSPMFGGCVKLSFNGSQLSFSSRAGEYGNGFSVGFPSFFPSSFVFKAFNAGTFSNCYDPRLIVLVLNILFGIPIMFLTSGSTGFWILSCVGYWTVTLSLDPPISVDASNPDTVAELFSIGFQRFLPLMFILYIFHKSPVSVTLGEPTSMVFRLIGWYPMFWMGIANNITFDRLPVDRLTAEDIKRQPGGLIAILGILSSIFLGIGLQIYRGWYAGKLYRYLKGYLFVIIGLLSLALLPRLQLRIHHYILGLLLLPATATKGPSAFLFQGVLLGLLISGVAKWDFASIVETNVSLLRGEAGALPLPPSNLTYDGSTISWNAVVSQNPYDPLDGYSLIINDIERYVGNETSLVFESLLERDSTLKLALEAYREAAGASDIPLFIRVGRSSTKKYSLDRGDYTAAATLYWPSGNWTAPPDGLT